MYTGETIRLLRLLKGFSQKGIARKLGISQAAYSKLEKRKAVNNERGDKILMIIECSADEVRSVEQFASKY